MWVRLHYQVIAQSSAYVLQCMGCRKHFKGCRVLHSEKQRFVVWGFAIDLACRSHAGKSFYNIYRSNRSQKPIVSTYIGIRFNLRSINDTHDVNCWWFVSPGNRNNLWLYSNGWYII